MIKRITTAGLCLIMLMGLGACASTETDPRKGGLFSYNPTAYQQRIADREATLADTEEANAMARQEGAALDADKQHKQVAYQDLKARMASLYAQTSKLEDQLAKARAINTSQKAKLKRLQDEAASIKSATIQMNNSGESLSTKAGKLAALQKKMDELLKEAEALSAL
ncbi:hypothetical protein [Desulfobacter vibrioformis]|uniref:hypothetical protein n=1 Tax=Desulfobacter vibrioformis TaxID=34031 RepID=UPI00055401E3|nr:hypothetical protein [Desulfobacter vibrioformis]